MPSLKVLFPVTRGFGVALLAAFLARSSLGFADTATTPGTALAHTDETLEFMASAPVSGGLSVAWCQPGVLVGARVDPRFCLACSRRGSGGDGFQDCPRQQIRNLGKYRIRPKEHQLVSRLPQ